MASGLLKSRHVKMRGSSVMFGRGAQLESPVAVDSGSKGTMDATGPGWVVGPGVYPSL